MNILIAEDNAINQKLLGAMLEAEGHHVFPANDGLEAMKILEHEKIEAVISDILMPRMDGYRLCKTVRLNHRLAHIPFIFYTSTYTSAADEKLALRMGADKYLKKPTSCQEILETLHKLPARRRVGNARPRPKLGKPAMKEYSEALIRKLDQKVVQLAAAKEALANLSGSLEQQVRERTALLLAAHQELETFTYSLAHDLRTPLRAINGLSLSVLQDCSHQLDQPARSSLEQICASTRRMNELIDGLLELSRATRAEIRRSEIDLSALARQILAELQQGEPQRQVEISLTDNLTAKADPALLRTAMANLLGNAWKFTARKPFARIEFGSAGQHSTINSQFSTIFFVRDNGAGFDMAYTDKLFAPFNRLHSGAEFPGHGIGLTIVQRVIQRHGGRIWAEGKPDYGATFFFTLQ